MISVHLDEMSSYFGSGTLVAARRRFFATVALEHGLEAETGRTPGAARDWRSPRSCLEQERTLVDTGVRHRDLLNRLLEDTTKPAVLVDEFRVGHRVGQEDARGTVGDRLCGVVHERLP